MHTIKNNISRKFEFKDVMYYKNCLLCSQSFRLNTLHTKAITRKESFMCLSEWIGFYGLPWGCVETSSSEASIPICQLIWRHMRQVSNHQQHLF